MQSAIELLPSVETKSPGHPNTTSDPGQYLSRGHNMHVSPSGPTKPGAHLQFKIDELPESESEFRGHAKHDVLALAVL